MREINVQEVYLYSINPAYHMLEGNESMLGSHYVDISLDKCVMQGNDHKTTHTNKTQGEREIIPKKM